MKVGAERKKVAILGGLLLVAGYFFYSNVLSDSNLPPEARRSADSSAGRPSPLAPAATPAVPAVRPPQPRRVGSRVRSSEEWHPSLKRRADDPLDPTAIDPTLRLDLLAKVQGVEMAGGSRSVFQFSAPPPPPLPKEPKVVPKPAAEVAKAAEPPKPAAPPPPPPPPPITLKYYGFSSAKGLVRKTAFFLDGEDILVAAEGDTVKRRYKVVRIGVNSVVMEDTESKSQQTLPLQEDTSA